MVRAVCLMCMVRLVCMVCLMCMVRLRQTQSRAHNTRLNMPLGNQVPPGYLMRWTPLPRPPPAAHGWWPSGAAAGRRLSFSTATVDLSEPSTSTAGVWHEQYDALPGRHLLGRFAISARSQRIGLFLSNGGRVVAHLAGRQSGKYLLAVLLVLSACIYTRIACQQFSRVWVSHLQNECVNTLAMLATPYPLCNSAAAFQKCTRDPHNVRCPPAPWEPNANLLRLSN